MASCPCLEARDRLSKISTPLTSKWFPHGSPNRYFPASKIYEIFTADNFLSEVYQCGCATCRSDSDQSEHERARAFMKNQEKLQKNYLTTYALLIWLKNAGLIRYFLEKEVYLNGSTFFKADQLSFIPQSIRNEVVDEQYKFQVRIIEPRTEHVTIPTKEALPIQEEDAPKGKGAFGQVYGFTIPHDEYRGKEFKEKRVTRFVRKIFEGSQYGQSGFGLKEWVNHVKLKGIEHNHLMTVFGAFSHGEHFFIISEEASGTLEDYFKSDGTDFTPEKLWEQVQGLADGLSHLHRLHDDEIAYHRDLKPANILILNGVMRISDFGLLQFKLVGPPSESLSRYSGNIGDRDYAAPQNNGQSYNEFMDMWSLGAIISEIATFDLQKKEGIKGYRYSRRNEGDLVSFANFHIEGHLKDAVRSQHNILYEKVVRSKASENREGLHPFQQAFFTNGFFIMVERMLGGDRFGNTTPISASGVASYINRLILSARSNQPADVGGRESIHTGMENGAFGVESSNRNCRLCAYFPSGSECGIILNSSPKNRGVTVSQFYYNSADILCCDTHYLNRPREGDPPFCLEYGPTFFPDYVQEERSAVDYKVRIHPPDGPELVYIFHRGIREPLILQAAMINQYAYRFHSFKLESFTAERRKWPGKAETVIKDYEAPVVQLWSEGPLDDDTSLWSHGYFELIPKMHLAIICMRKRKLCLIKAESLALDNSAPEKTIILRKIGIREINIELGIPMQIFTPEQSEKYDKDAQLKFGSDSDKKSFQTDLAQMKSIWRTLKSRDQAANRLNS